MANTKFFIWTALCLGLALGAPQNLVRLVPADLGLGSGLRAIPADSLEGHSVHTVHEDAPVFGRLIQTSDGLAHIGHQGGARLVQTSPLVTRLVQAAPAVTRVVPAAPAVTVVQAAPAPVRTVVEEVQTETVDPNPQYNFGYSVADTITGDSKTREEQRDGDVVTGSYTVADPDGRIRRVTYTADAVNGFQAKVTYDGEEGPVAIPSDAGVAETAVDNDSATVVDARQNQVVVQQAAATPTLVRTVPQPIGAATLVRNINGGRVLHRIAAAQQPQLIQIGNGDEALIRGLDAHALHGVAQPQFVQIEGTDQTFEVTPFGLRSLPLGARFAQSSPLLDARFAQSSPLIDAHFVQA